MEFVIEPCYGITISAGDLLLTTCPLHEVIWIGCVFMDDERGYYITASCKCVISGNVSSDDCTYRCNSTITDITRRLFTYGGVMDGKWRSIPRHFWSAIYEFIYSRVY